jgi:hypothetical protein
MIQSCGRNCSAFVCTENRPADAEGKSDMVPQMVQVLEWKLEINLMFKI